MPWASIRHCDPSPCQHNQGLPRAARGVLACAGERRFGRRAEYGQQVIFRFGPGIRKYSNEKRMPMSLTQVPKGKMSSAGEITTGYAM